MEFLPILIFWVLTCFCFMRGGVALLYLFFGCLSFGSFAVIPTNLTQGLTLTPAPMVALIFILRMLASSRGIKFALAMSLSPKRMLYVFLFLLVAAFTSYFMPRLFEGTTIIPMQLDKVSFGDPLVPTTQNLSQLAYLTISVFSILAFARLFINPVNQQHLLKALCLGATVAVATGFIDFLAPQVGLTSLLEPFRTATYALITGAEILGSKRVVGLMPEASAYGGLCVSFLAAIYFMRRSMKSAFLRLRVAPVLVGLLFLFVWLSTSSGAYVALVVFMLFAAMEWGWRASAVRPGSLQRKGLAVEFWIAFIGLVGVCAIVLFFPSLVDPIIEGFNEMVFKKTQTSSFEERSMWTAVSWNALMDTYGLGVGMGGTRASNAVVAVASNTGILGVLLYFVFVVRTLFGQAPKSENARSLYSSVRWAFLPNLVTDVLAGTTADFGLFKAWLFAIALAVAISKLPERKALGKDAGTGLRGLDATSPVRRIASANRSGTTNR